MGTRANCSLCGSRMVWLVGRNRQGRCFGNNFYSGRLRKHSSQARTPVVVVSVQQPNQGIRRSNRRNSDLLSDFRNVVGDRRAPRREKDIIARRAMTESLTPWDISNLLHFMKKGNYRNSMLLENLARQTLDSRAGAKGFNRIQMTMSIVALAVMASRGGQSFPSFKELWSAFVRERFARERTGEEEFDEQNIASVVYAFGLLFGKRSGLAMDVESKALLDLILMKLTKGGAGVSLLNCNDRELSNIVYGLGLMEYGDEGVLNALGEEIRQPERLKAFAEQGLSNIVYGFSLLGYRNEAVLDALSEEIMQPVRLNAFIGQALSNIVYGFALLGHRHEGVLNALSEEIRLGERLERFTDQELSNIVYGFALLGYRNVAVLDALGKEMIRPKRLKSFMEQHFSNIVYGFGLLRYSNEQVLGALANEMAHSSRLSRFKQQELSNSVYGFALLECCNAKVLNALGEEIGKPERLKAFTTQGLSNIVYGFGVLKHKNLTVLDALGGEIRLHKRLQFFKQQELSNIVYGFGLLGYCNEDVLDPLGREVMQPERLAQFQEQELSNILYGLGLLKHNDPKVLDALCGEIRQLERLKAFKEQELSNIVYGLGLLTHKNPGMLDALSEEIMQPKRLEAFKEQEVSNIVYGLGLMEYGNDAVMNALGEEIRQPKRLHAFNEQNLANIVYGFALSSGKMNHLFTSGKMEAFLASLAQEISTKDRLAVFSAQEVANIAWSLAKLAYLDTSLMDQLIKRFFVAVESTNTVDKKEISMLLHGCAMLNLHHDEFLDYVFPWVNQELQNETGACEISNYMWGLAFLGNLSPTLFMRMCKKLIEVECAGLKQENFSQVWQAYLYAKSLKGFELDSEMSSLVERARRCFKEGNMSGASGLEMDVSRTLDELGIGHAMQHEVGEACMVVDILIGGEEGIAVEADGPTHYTINKLNGQYSQLGGTVFRNWILQKMGFKVLCVPHFEWRILNSEQKKEWLKSKLEVLQ